MSSIRYLCCRCFKLNDRTESIKKKCLQEIEELNPSDLPLDRFFLKIFSILQGKIDFQSCWYFPVDTLSGQRTLNSLQIWADSPPRLEMERILLDDRCFPSVNDLLDKKVVSLRGETWWSASQLLRHPLYWKYLKDGDLFYSFVGLLLDADERCIAYLTLWREKEKGAFNDVEFSLLSELLPVIGGLLKNIAHDSKVFDKKNPISRPPARLFKPIEKVVGINEEELYSLIRRRAQPGILILNQSGEMLYSNHDARRFLDRLSQKSESLKPSDLEKGTQSDVDKPADNTRKKGAFNTLPLPEIVYELYDYFVNSGILNENEVEEAMPTVNRICIQGGMVFLLRALKLRQHGGEPNYADIMILVERVSQGVRVDQIGETTKLTPREGEVVQLLLEGKTNKEVAVCIEIGEYTVKDHIKRIMKKLEVTTRAGIVAKVLQSHFPA